MTEQQPVGSKPFLDTITADSLNVKQPEVIPGGSIIPEAYQQIANTARALVSGEINVEYVPDGHLEHRGSMIPGANPEIHQEKDNLDYARNVMTTGIDAVTQLINAGFEEKAGDLLATITGYVDKNGPFVGALENGVITTKDVYKLLELNQASSKSWLVSRSALALEANGQNQFKIENESHDRADLVDSILDMAIADENRDRGNSIAAMIGEYLADTESHSEKRDFGGAPNENEKRIRKIFESFGIHSDQTGEIFEALAQSTNEKNHVLLRTRFNDAMSLLTSLEAELPNKDELHAGVQKLVRKFGIRNLQRYSAEDLLPQLSEDYIPDSLVATAFTDETGALNAPANSARGLEYENPVYFEIESPLDIAKTIITTRKMTEDPLDKILIRGHGSSEGVLLSRQAEIGHLDTKDIDKRGVDIDAINKKRIEEAEDDEKVIVKKGWEEVLVDKGYVSPDVEVVFESCSLGADGFHESLKKRSGIKALTAEENLKGSSVEGAPAVMRRQDGSVGFGEKAPSTRYEKDENGQQVEVGHYRSPEDLSDPAQFSEAA